MQRMKRQLESAGHSAIGKEFNLLFTSLIALFSLYTTFAAVLERPLFAPFTTHPSNGNNTTAGVGGSQLNESETIAQLTTSFFSVFLLWACALGAGRIFHHLRMPPLFGMLLVGIAFANIAPLKALLLIRSSWDSFLRKTAFVLILLRCGIGLNPASLKKTFVFCTGLGVLSTSAEILAIVLIAFLFFRIPLSVSILFGFVLASTSPAVTVPTMIQLQHNKRGTEKGIPTMVLASASIDNIFAISGFTIAYAIVSAVPGQLSSTLIRIPSQLIGALILGCFVGGLLRFFPHPTAPSVHFSRTLLLCSCSMALYFGTKAVNFDVSGPIAVILACFFAAVRWKTDNSRNTRVEAEALKVIWNMLLLPLLFVLIGLLLDFSIFSLALFERALIVMGIGILVRICAVLVMAKFNNGLNWKERLFFLFAFLPKATVQAALAPLLYQFALANSPNNDRTGAQFVLQTCILSILLTAPIGQLLIQSSGNLLLSRDKRQLKQTVNTIELPKSTATNGVLPLEEEDIEIRREEEQMQEDIFAEEDDGMEEKEK